MKFVLTAILCLFSYLGYSAGLKQAINYFIVKENLLKNEKIAIIATDSLENPLESINGVFNFSVNGFKQELQFNDGVAVCPLQIEKSAFIFIKHSNDFGNHSNLYYVYKKEKDLSPYKISWVFLIAIPILLILIGYMFRKLIGFVVFALVLFLYFNYSKGLTIPTFLESVLDGIRNLF
jgi:hypothetical protein